MAQVIAAVENPANQPSEPPRTPPPPTGPRTPPPPTGPKKADGKADQSRRPLGTAEEIAVYLGVPVATLHQWRHKGTGPRASKVGRWLRYRWTDVEKWLDDQAKTA